MPRNRANSSRANPAPTRNNRPAESPIRTERNRRVSVSLSPQRNRNRRQESSNRTNSTQQRDRRRSISVSPQRGRRPANTQSPVADRRRSQSTPEASSSSEEPPRQQARQPTNRNQRDNRRKNKSPKRCPPHIREIIKLRSTQNLLIPRLPFSRLVREIMHERSLEIARITPTAFQALQEAAESYLVVLFEDAYKITMSRKQVTLQGKDIELVRYLRRETD